MKSNKIIDPKDMEIISVLIDKAKRECIEGTGLNKTDFNYLLIANLHNDQGGRFNIPGINRFIGKNHLAIIHKSIIKMTKLNFVEKVINKRIYGINGKVQCESAYYTVTGKAIYLIRKYAEVLNTMMVDEKQRTKI